MSFWGKIPWALLFFSHEFESFLHEVKPSWHEVTADSDIWFSPILVFCGNPLFKSTFLLGILPFYL